MHGLYVAPGEGKRLVSAAHEVVFKVTGAHSRAASSFVFSVSMSIILRSLDEPGTSRSRYGRPCASDAHHLHPVLDARLVSGSRERA